MVISWKEILVKELHVHKNIFWKIKVWGRITQWLDGLKWLERLNMRRLMNE